MDRPAALIVPLFALLPLAAAEDKPDKDVRRSVVQVHATQRIPNVLRPWEKQSPREVTGSGAVLDGKRILTNAHVVRYANPVYVQPYQSSDKFAATVERIDPSLDLAVLRLENEAFFKDRPPVPRAPGLPEVKDAVTVYGYPVGGASLAVTRASVARIGLTAYGYGDYYGFPEVGLQIQIDGAVNPGNSGGPALVKERMVGLVYAGLAEAQNVGYVIPNEEIDAFLRGDGRGKPYLAEYVQALQNEALRKKLRLAPDTRGLFVRRPASLAPTYPLKAGDVITHIGPYEIDNDSQVRVKDGLRLSWAYLVPKLARKDAVPLTVLRQGKAQRLDVPVARNSRYVVKALGNKYPPYFVWGPLVFSPATTALVMGLTGHVPDDSPLNARRNDEAAFPGEELVVVVTMLPHKISNGYRDPVGQVVRAVNGTPIRNLRHLVETLRDARGPFVEIEFHERRAETLVFDRKEVLAATDDILSDNNIGKQCSDAELRKVWQSGK